MTEIDLRPELDHRVYRYGFACFPEHAPVDRTLLRDWNLLRLNGHLLAVHPEAEIRVVPTRAGTCVVIGEVFVAHGLESLDELLARHVVTGDWSAIDQVSGRFVLLVLTESSVHVLNDPIGSRAVFYTIRGPRIVGSHAGLVAGIAGFSLDRDTSRYMASPEYRARRTRYLPGDCTRYRHVVSLTPNTVLELVTRATQRFWPRTPFEPSTFDDVFELVDEYFRNYAKVLATRYSPVVGMTGGSDCRALLSGLVAHGISPRLITWSGPSESELLIIERLVNHLGLPHTMIESSDVADAASAKVTAASVLNTSLTRGRPRLPAMLAAHVGGTDVFIRGYGGEVMRGSWNSRFVPRLGTGIDGMVGQFLTRAVRAPTEEHSRFTCAAYEDFAVRADFDANDPPYDLGDLHYLEQRMPVWAASVMNEADSVMRTHAGFNSRPVYLASLSLPDAERFDKQLMFRIAARYDPDFARM